MVEVFYLHYTLMKSNDSLDLYNRTKMSPIMVFWDNVQQRRLRKNEDKSPLCIEQFITHS